MQMAKMTASHLSTTEDFKRTWIAGLLLWRKAIVDVHGIVKCNRIEGLVVNDMKLGTDVTSLTIANQANSQSMFLGEAKKLSFARMRFPLWNLLSILQTRIKNI